MKTLIFCLAILTSLSAIAAHHAHRLADKAGMTLYTFDKDSNGTSNCYGGCEGTDVKEGWGMTTRKDGAKQWTYNDQPLYTWVGDQKAGDITGDGVGGVWYIAKKSHKQATKKAADANSNYDY